MRESTGLKKVREMPNKGSKKTRLGKGDKKKKLGEAG